MQNTLLLLHGDSFTDKSIYSRSVASNGVSTTYEMGRFDRGSFAFNGSSYLEIPNLVKGGGEFTVELWLYPTNQSNNTVWSHGGTNVAQGTGGGFEFFNDRSFIYYCNGFHIQTAPYALNQWYHFAAIGDGNGAIKLYIDGHLVGQYTQGYTMETYSEVFGANQSAITLECFYGYMSEIRVSNVARWASDFTPPTEPYEDYIDNRNASKVVVIQNGVPKVLMDLTEDTVTAETLVNGYTAHDKSGRPIIGTHVDTGIHPSGSLIIEENGDYDITQYASVNVALPDGSGVSY